MLSKTPHIVAKQQPFLGGPNLGSKTKPAQSSQCKEYALLLVYSNYHLPVIVFPCHYVGTRSPGRGSTEIYIRCIVKLYHLCRFEVNVVEVFTASKKRGEHGNVFKVVNHHGLLSHLQSELVDPPSPYAAVVGNFIVCQCRTSVTRIFL